MNKQTHKQEQKEKEEHEDDVNPKIDEWTKRELVLSVENDSELYDKRAIPLAENYIKKLRKGRFREDSQRLKGVLNLVRYEMLQLRQNKINIGRISAETKLATAQHLYESYIQPIMEQS